MATFTTYNNRKFVLVASLNVAIRQETGGDYMGGTLLPVDNYAGIWREVKESDIVEDLRTRLNAKKGSRARWAKFNHLTPADVLNGYITQDHFETMRGVQYAFYTCRIAGKARIALEGMTAYKFCELLAELIIKGIWAMDDVAYYVNAKYNMKGLEAA